MGFPKNACSSNALTVAFPKWWLFVTTYVSCVSREIFLMRSTQGSNCSTLYRSHSERGRRPSARTIPLVAAMQAYVSDTGCRMGCRLHRAME